MKTQNTPSQTVNLRQIRLHDAVLLVSLLMLLWSCVMVPRTFAAEATTPTATNAAAETTKAKGDKVVAKAEKALKDQAGTVNINTADAATLATVMVGIGPKKAEAIVAYRQEKGKFTSIDQLLDVKGIGQATLDKNRAKLTL